MKKTRNLVKRVPNPTGKGGFGERPQDISSGRWSGETSISYNYNKLIRMTVLEIKEWLKNNPDERRTMAQELAYQAVISARKDLSYLKEVTDRTEGKAVQKVQMEVNDITDELDKLESDYGRLGSQAERQMVEDDASLQNKE